MTDIEFQAKQDKILQDIPKEFHGALSYMAWNEGHSAGYNEVLGYLSDFVYNLKEAIEKYTQRIKK
jgi:hypothetical protein